MKNFFSIILIFSFYIVRAQTLNYQPFIKTQQNDGLMSKVYNNNGELVFTLGGRLASSQWADTSKLIAADTTLNVLHYFNLRNLAHKSIPLKSSLDTLVYALELFPFYNGTKKSYYFRFAKMALSNYSTNGDSLSKNMFLLKIDSTFENTQEIKIQNVSGGYRIRQTNFIAIMDSLLFTVQDNYQRTLLVKHNINNGLILDTLHLLKKHPQSLIVSLDMINDSTLIALSDISSIVNCRSMVILDTNLLKFDNNNFFVITKPKFNNLDTTYKLYEREYSATITDEASYYNIDKINFVSKLFGIDYNSVPQLQTTSLNSGTLAYDFISNNYVYTCLTNVVFSPHSCVISSNLNGTTNWIKYIDGDTNLYIHPQVVATQDSGAIIFISRKEPNSPSNNLDIYATKFDKFGNQQSNLSIVTSNKPILIKQQGMLIVFPNPTTQKLYIRNIEESSIKQIEIYNQNGQLLSKLKGKLELDFLNWADGNYFIVVKTSNNIFKAKFTLKN